MKQKRKTRIRWQIGCSRFFYFIVEKNTREKSVLMSEISTTRFSQQHQQESSLMFYHEFP